VPASARFCPGCGRVVDPATGTTLREELPATETGEVPVTYVRSEPRWFGVAPPLVLLVLTIVGLVAGVFLVATGDWPFGLIVLGLALFLGTAFLEVARRKPGGEAARRSLDAMDDVRSRAGSILEALAVRSRASREAALLRIELRRLYQRRRDLLTAFGDAVYRGAEAEGLRRQLTELDERARRLDDELHALAIDARDRIEKARMSVGETQMLPVAATSVPEPYPPPDEGSPAQPAVVPEPGPPPDEGTPPQPDPVPTPGPAPTPDE